MSLDTIQSDIDDLKERGIEPDIIEICYRNQMTNELLRRMTKKRLSLYTNDELAEIVQLLDRLGGDGDA